MDILLPICVISILILEHQVVSSLPLANTATPNKVGTAHRILSDHSVHDFQNGLTISPKPLPPRETHFQKLMFDSGHKGSPGILQNPAKKLKQDINLRIDSNNNKRTSPSPQAKNMLGVTTKSSTKKVHNGNITPQSVNSDETDIESSSSYSFDDFSGLDYKSEEKEEELVEEHAPVDEAHINDDDTTHDGPLLNADEDAGTSFNSPSRKEETNTLDTSKNKTGRKLDDSPAGKQSSPAQKSTSEKEKEMNADSSKKRSSSTNGKDDKNPPPPESEPEEPAPTPEPLSSQKSDQGNAPMLETNTKPPIEAKLGNFLIVNSQTYKNLAEVLEEILQALHIYEKLHSHIDELDIAPEDPEEFLDHEDTKIIEQNAKSDPQVVTPASSPRLNEPSKGNGIQPAAKVKTPVPVKYKPSARNPTASMSANKSASFAGSAPNETVAKEWADLMSTVKRMALDPEKSESTASIIKEILEDLPKDQNLDRFFDEPLAILQASQNQKVGDILKSIKETQHPQRQPSNQHQQQSSIQQLQPQLLPAQYVQLKPRPLAIYNSQKNEPSNYMFSELKNKMETMEEKLRQKMTSNPMGHTTDTLWPIEV